MLAACLLRAGIAACDATAGMGPTELPTGHVPLLTPKALR